MDKKSERKRRTNLLRMKLINEYDKISVWHVLSNVPYVMPDQFKKFCEENIDKKIGNVDYYKKCLENNSRYWELNRILFPL